MIAPIDTDPTIHGNNPTPSERWKKRVASAGTLMAWSFVVWILGIIGTAALAILAEQGVFGERINRSGETEPPISIMVILGVVFYATIIAGFVLDLISGMRLSTADEDCASINRFSSLQNGIYNMVIYEVGAFVLAIVLFLLGTVAFAYSMTVEDPSTLMLTSLVVFGVAGLCTLVMSIAKVIRFFNTCTLIAYYAELYESQGLASFARHTRWLFPLLATVGSLLLIGPLIAAAIYNTIHVRLGKTIRLEENELRLLPTQPAA